MSRRKVNHALELAERAQRVAASMHRAGNVAEAETFEDEAAAAYALKDGAAAESTRKLPPDGQGKVAHEFGGAIADAHNAAEGAKRLSALEKAWTAYAGRTSAEWMRKASTRIFGVLKDAEIEEREASAEKKVLSAKRTTPKTADARRLNATRVALAVHSAELLADAHSWLARAIVAKESPEPQAKAPTATKSAKTATATAKKAAKKAPKRAETPAPAPAAAPKGRKKKAPAPRRRAETGTTGRAVVSRGDAPIWHDLILPGGAYDKRIQTATNGKSGAYAFRERGGAVLYVGESHTDRLWKTLLRHVHGQTSFKKQGEWVYRRPEALEIAVWTSPATEAEALETRLIAALKPTENENVSIRSRREASLFKSQFDDEESFDDWVNYNVKNNPAGPNAEFNAYKSDYAEALRLQEEIEANTLAMLRTGDVSVFAKSAAAFKRMQKIGDRMRKARDRHGWNLPALFLIRREARDLGLFGDDSLIPSTQQIGTTLRSNPGAAMRPNAAALADYEETHWNEEGDNDGEIMNIPTPTRGVKIVALGLLRSVDYETTKGGDAGPTIYRHAFDKRRPPTLAYLYNPKTNKRGGLVIAGGVYKVENRGIVK